MLECTQQVQKCCKRMTWMCQKYQCKEYTFTPVWLSHAPGVTSLLPNDSMWPLIKQIKIFFWYTDYISKVSSFLSYTRKLLGCLLGISPSGRNSCRGKFKKKDSGAQQYCRDNSILNNSHVLNTKLQVSIWFTRF